MNASNLRFGGGVQRAVEFVRASTSYPSDHRFTYVVSDVVARNLESVVDVGGLDMHVAPVSPARPWSGRATRHLLRQVESRLRPDVVFSIFGPTYTRFRSPHLMGFAVPWVTHPNAHAWRTLASPGKRLRHWLWCRHTEFWTRWADRWVLETRVAADGLARVLGVPRDRIDVIPNVCSHVYHEARERPALPDPRMRRASETDFNLLVFSAYYPHKNLEMIPTVAAELRRRDPRRRYRFFLTFDRESAAWHWIHAAAARLGVGEDVVNLGPVPVREGPGLYAAADALFMPTVLESFTATYLEAMCLRTPIVTSDLSFARDICGEAAWYCQPADAAAAAEQILIVGQGGPDVQARVSQGEARLARGRTPRDVYDLQLASLDVTARWRQASPILQGSDVSV